jgi:hypothetical protein
MRTGKDLGPLRKLARSALISHMHKAALDNQQPFHYALGAFMPNQMLAWAKAYWKNRIGKKHPFQIYATSNGIFPLVGDGADAEVRVAIAGDWGTGTDEAFQVAQRMREHGPHFTAHLGDVYYVGDESEVLENFLGVPDPKHNFTPCDWPLGSVGTFDLSGNHEMYARGFAYFDTILPRMGTRTGVGGSPQEASFFCLKNDHWIVLGLDTAYDSIGTPILENIFTPKCGLTQEQLGWLRNIVKLQDDHQRGIILLTHHQYYSSFESPYPKAAQQLAEFIKRPVLWWWGHEHRMAIYSEHSIGDGIAANGRCIGHGGMPIELNSKIKHPDVPLLYHDTRRYPSPENITVGYNGHINLAFRGPDLFVDYVDVAGTRIASEKWSVGNNGFIFSNGVSLLIPQAKLEEARTARELAFVI